jgi:hypothetical protein
MGMTGGELAAVRALIERMHSAVPRELRLHPRPLRGGLEAVAVSRLAARYRDDRGNRRTVTMIVKRLAGAARREALVYERLVAKHAADLSPRLLGLDVPRDDEAVLYLEAISRTNAWPWRDPRAAQSVLQGVARLHAATPTPETLVALERWDYETELRRSAELTVERLDEVRRLGEYAAFSAALRPTCRLAQSLSGVRRELLGFRPFGGTVIHGDLHPGNAMLRRRRCPVVVLLDWGRARVGSALEDVSSWLQSLGGWEPEARRRHDTLFAGYLSARALDCRLTTELRGAYWLAGASNALSGALLHHLTSLRDRRLPAAVRAGAARSALDWLRVLRRADAYWS